MKKKFPTKWMALPASVLRRIPVLSSLLFCSILIQHVGLAQCGTGNNIGFGGIAANNTLTVCKGAVVADTLINSPGAFGPTPFQANAVVTYFWQVSTDGGTIFQIPGTGSLTKGLPSSVISDLLNTAGTYQFRRFVSKSLYCDDYSDIVVLNVIENTADAGPALNTLCTIVGPSTPTLDGAIGGAATAGLWSDGGVGGTFTPTANDLAATWAPPNLYTGTATLTLSATGGGCTAATAFKKVAVVNGDILAFTQQPLDTILQNAPSTISVSVNICGSPNVNLTYFGAITLKIKNGCGFTTRTVNAISGTATFGNVVINRSPQTDLQFEASATGYAPVLSNTFYVDGPGGTPQTDTIAREDFEGATTWGYSLTTSYSGSGGSGTDDTKIKMFSGNNSLAKSYTTENGVGQRMSTTTIQFNTISGLGVYKTLRLKFRIGSLYDPSGSPGPVGDQGGAGVDPAENMRFEVNINGTWHKVFKYVIGTENYLFSLSSTYAGIQHNKNDTYTNPIIKSGFVVIIPDGCTALSFQMIAANNRPSENWVIDDILLTGVLNSPNLPDEPLEAYGGSFITCPDSGPASDPQNSLSLLALNTHGAVSYSWSPAAGLDNPTSAAPIPHITGDVSYVGTITDADGCTDTGRIDITIPGGVPGIWTGAENNDWFYCRNWTAGVVPTITTDVLLPNNAGDTIIIEPISPYAAQYGNIAYARNLEVIRALHLQPNAQLKVGGNLTIQTTNNTVKGSIDMTSFGAHADPNSITVGGDWLNKRTAAGFVPGKSTVSFIGSGAQAIATANASGTEPFYNLKVNKPSGELSLTNNSLVTGTLTLTKGIVNTYTSAPANTLGLLTLADTGTAVAGPPSASSFVNGQLAKIFKTSGAASRFYLPVGKKPTYKYAAIEPTSTSGTTTFTAEYFIAAPPLPAYVVSPDLLGIHGTQYWNIVRSGTADAKIILPYVYNSNWVGGTDNATMPGPGPAFYVNNQVAVAQQIVTAWNITAPATSLSSATNPPEYRYFYNNGEIMSVSLNAFGPFSLGYIYNAILPVKLLGFDGRLTGSNATLTWNIADATDLQGFVLEYSTNGRNYTNLADITANGSLHYNYADQDIPTGVRYYRLLVKEKNGNHFYSSVVVLNSGALNTEIIGLVSTVVKNSLQIKIRSLQNQTVAVRVTDIAGRQVIKQNTGLKPGENQLPLSVALLSKGLYFISIQTTDGAKKTMQFIKE